jgi:anti-sigma regulatory factor (Ser/Thr protein kinase)
MVNRIHKIFNASDRSYFSIIKKEIHAIAVSGNFDEKKLGKIDIVVAEIVSNLSKHADDGKVLVRLVEENGMQGLEIIAIDNGPGMSDVRRMMPDGVSTKNTLGQGLGAIKRMSDFFQIYSVKDWGTVVIVRIFNKETPSLKNNKFDIRSILVPKPGETACGDGFYSIITNEHIKLFLGDGLGHGPEAAKAVITAGESFLKSTQDTPEEIIKDINLAVKKTRGLVGTVVVFDIKEKKWKICGVGNISTKIISPDQTKNYIGYNGIIGLNLSNNLHAQEISFDPGQHLIMCSDGLKSRWDLIKHPSIFRYDLSMITATLFKDFARNTDDMSVVTCKINL